jgi:uncharacterized protein (TIGR00369 family)
VPAGQFAFDDERQSLLDAGTNTGYFKWAGLHVQSVSEGAARICFTPRREMFTPWDTLNGGVLNGLIEFPSFVALLTLLDPGQSAVTNDIFLQHMRPLPDGEYVMEGRVLRRGKRMAWTEVGVTNGGALVTVARVTKTIIPAPRSQ